MPPQLVRRGMDELFPQHRRSQGKHVSAAIFNIMKALYPDKWGKFEGKPIDTLRANLGNAFERTLVNGLHQRDPDRYVIPGELEHEGWYGTPDLWDLGPDGKDFRTVEMKMTWASMKRASDIEDVWFWRYWTQLKAYAHMAGTTKGTLMILFINGNYSRDMDDPDGGPNILSWEDEWTVDELQENWSMIKSQC